MGAYLDRLNEQHEEIRRSIDSITDAAAEAGRDVTDDEQAQVDRDQEKLTQLTAAIQRYTSLEEQSQAVQVARGKVASVPKVQRATVTEPEYDVAREFPTVGDYVITVHRAMVKKDPQAIEKLDRATAHQLLADNPGIVPRPVLGPVLNLIDDSRPFINSIVRKPLPAGSFDRPTITQHVKVGVQATEKTLTESQKMTIGKLPVTAKTYAGHLNISRQDIKWTSPGIMQIVFDDFAAIYAQTTCDDASDSFVTSCTNAATPIAPGGAAGVSTAADINKALFTSAAASMNAQAPPPDTLWVAPDVWAVLGGMTVAATGLPSYPSLSLTSTGGNPLGLKLVVEPHFVAGTMIMGSSRLVEWYEDVDGLMQVGEPDVLGQLVGYAGFGAFLNLAPTTFQKFTLDVTP